MSDDLLVDFGQSIFDLAGNALGMGGLEITLGKIAIEALAHSVEDTHTEDSKLAHYNLIKKIDQGHKTNTPVALTAQEVPILRKALNRTVDIITFGRIHDILEGSKK